MAYKTIDDLIANSNGAELESFATPEQIYYDDFILEIEDYLNQIDVDLVRYENNTSKNTIIKQIYKKYKSVKGLAGFFSETEIEKLINNSVKIAKGLKFDRIKKNQNIIDILYNTNELVRGLLKDEKSDKNLDKKIEEYLNEIDIIEFK